MSEDAPFHCGVGGREVIADVALADGAQEGVGQGVQAGVGVGVADQRPVVVDPDAAQPDRVARGRSGGRRSPGRCASDRPASGSAMAKSSG